MKFETSRRKGWLIGDPHLGRDFRNGTPLHRRGEREAMQLAQFREELATPDVDLVVMVGDLFDKPFVPLNTIHQAVDAVVEAAQARPGVTFYFLAGNHDKSRQLAIKGAWELFSVAVRWLSNVVILDQPACHDGIAFYPWQWDRTALEQVEHNHSHGCKVAIGHWDLISFGGDDSHIAPTDALMAAHGADVQIFSGHYHEEGIFKVGDVNVLCTGSMQPYTHAEDPNGDLYLTLTTEQLAGIDPDELRNKCVRVILNPGEEMPDVDCLQLTSKKADSEAEEVELGEVGIGAFDLHAVLAEEFAGNEVPDQVQGFIKERIGAFN
jgi:predicted phosphodiesterase